VVKNPSTGEYFHLGAQEFFLLTQLDGERSGAAIRAAFQERFGQPLSEAELQEFLALAAEEGLVSASAPPSPSLGEGDCRGEGDTTRPPTPLPQGEEGTNDAPRSPSKRQSILYWRKKLVDPDRLFTWLAPKLWFFWTRGFLVFSAGSILLAGVLLWSNRQELA